MQTRHWCFTINNWTSDDEHLLKNLGDNVSYLVFGYEVGDSGTHHLQGYVVFPKVKRFNEAKGALPGGAHLEPKRGSVKQASEYCKKDGLFQEYGSLPRDPGTGGQFDRFVEWLLQVQNDEGRVPTEREIATAYPSLWVRYGRKLRDLAEHHAPRPDLEDGDLRVWQATLKDVLLEAPPDDRGILFYIDTEGGKGKTWFQRFMLSRYPERVQILSVGKRDDIAHAIDEDKDIFLFNVPRGGMEFLNYTTIEQLKDRMVFSPKYDSRTKILKKNPHVCVFCNEQPDMTRMTEDRFICENMDHYV